MSLDLVEINLEKAFEQGMVYVALSRARFPQGLRIVGSVPDRALRVDPAVQAFYASLAVPSKV